jgi:hypothetical protein
MKEDRIEIKGGGQIEMEFETTKMLRSANAETQLTQR